MFKKFTAKGYTCLGITKYSRKKYASYCFKFIITQNIDTEYIYLDLIEYC